MVNRNLKSKKPALVRDLNSYAEEGTWNILKFLFAQAALHQPFMLLRNTGIHLQYFTVSQSRRLAYTLNIFKDTEVTPLVVTELPVVLSQ
jgi:hypothetical protein